MDEKTLRNRITRDPEIFGGKLILRGMRISVETVLSLLAQGEQVDGILEDYPSLQREDVQACIAYAHMGIANDTLENIRSADAAPDLPVRRSPTGQSPERG